MLNVTPWWGLTMTRQQYGQYKKCTGNGRGCMAALPCWAGDAELSAPRLCDGQASTKPCQGQRGAGVREKIHIAAISHPEISPQLHSLLKLTLNRPGCSRGGASGDPAGTLKKHPAQPMAPGFLCTYCSCHWLTKWSGNFLHSFAFKKDLRGPRVIPLHIPGGVGGCAPSCWAGRGGAPPPSCPPPPARPCSWK